MLKTANSVSKLLVRRERVSSVWVLAVLALASLAEMVGIASILPFLKVLTEPEALSETGSMRIIGKYLDAYDPIYLITVLGLMTLVAIVVAAVLRAVAVFAINTHSQKLRMGIGNRALAKLLNQPYSYYQNTHSGDLSKKILYDVDQLTNLFLVPFSRIVAQIFTATAIAALLFFTHPMLALIVACIIGSMYTAAHLMTRRVVNRLSYEASHANSTRFRIVSEAFGGIKELKVFGAEPWFEKAFLRPSFVLTRNQGINATLSETPRFFIETFTFGGIILSLLVIIQRSGLEGDTLSGVIPTMGLMIFAGYRLLPAAQQVFQGLNAIRFSGPFVESVYDVFQLDSKRTEPLFGDIASLPVQKGIRLADVSFQYDRGGGVGLYDLSMRIRAGEIVGVAGATGSGKTTLIDLILGLQSPQKGAIYVDDVKLDEDSLQRWKRSLSLVPQRIHLLDASISQNIAFGCPIDMIDQDLVRKCARDAQLDDVIQQLPDGYDTVIGEFGGKLSGGQQQRLGIARALYRRPSVLILDEATSALDNSTEHHVLDALAHHQPKMTIIAIAHRVEALKACDVVYFLQGGQVAGRDSFDALIAKNTQFRELVTKTLRP